MKRINRRKVRAITEQTTRNALNRQQLNEIGLLPAIGMGYLGKKLFGGGSSARNQSQTTQNQNQSQNQSIPARASTSNNTQRNPFSTLGAFGAGLGGAALGSRFLGIPGAAAGFGLGMLNHLYNRPTPTQNNTTQNNNSGTNPPQQGQFPYGFNNPQQPYVGYNPYMGYNPYVGYAPVPPPPPPAPAPYYGGGYDPYYGYYNGDSGSNDNDLLMYYLAMQNAGGSGGSGASGGFDPAMMMAMNGGNMDDQALMQMIWGLNGY